MLARVLPRTIAQARVGGKTAVINAARAAGRQPSGVVARAMSSVGVNTKREVRVASNQYYDGLANHYHMFQQDWDGMVKMEREAFKVAFEGENVNKVLDASCGSGEQSIALAGLGLSVTACDPSPGLLGRCHANAKKYGFDKAFRTQQSDFLNLTKDFSEELGSFDAIITKGSSLPHLHTDNDLRQALKNFHDLLRPGGIVNIGVRDYDYFINSTAKIYPRQVRVGREVASEHIIFDVWEWRKGNEGQQLVDFNTFHINGEGSGEKGAVKQHTAAKFVTTFRALFRAEMEKLMGEAGFECIKVHKIHDWLWENVYTARRPNK